MSWTKFQSWRHDSKNDVGPGWDSTSCGRLVNPKGSAAATSTGRLLGQDSSLVLIIILEIMTNGCGVFQFHSDGNIHVS